MLFISRDFRNVIITVCRLALRLILLLARLPPRSIYKLRRFRTGRRRNGVNFILRSLSVNLL